MKKDKNQSYFYQNLFQISNFRLIKQQQEVDKILFDLNYITLIMRRNQKVKTSVFSQYENNQNDSISSRQLQYWLKQTAPIIQPKFSGIQWTLMSTNSIFEQQQHTLQRNQTFQTINKENDYLSFNSARPNLNNASSMTKSKSYVNAMIDLQNKIKQLQSENQTLKQALNSLKDERTRNLNQSIHIAEEMKNRLQILEPKTKRIEQLTKQNKRLRDFRDQNNKKTKVLQKINKQNQIKMSDYERNLQKLQQTLKQKLKQISDLQNKNTQQTIMIEKNKQIMQKIQEKNKILEEMKQKSTSSIIEKYNKSVQMVEALTSENMKLKQQNIHLKQRLQQKFRQLDQKYRAQKQEWMKITEQMKLSIVQKKQLINNLNKDTLYFKQNYQRNNQQLIKTLKNHALQIRQIKEAHQKEAIAWRQKAVLYLQKKTEKKQSIIEINKESMIKSKEQQQKYQLQSQLQFEQLNSIEQNQQVIQIMRHQTRSLDKKSNKNSGAKSIVSKPIDCLSQKESKNISAESKSKQKLNSVLQESKRMKKSVQKVTEKSRSKEKSKSRQIPEAITNQNDHSFILKSCQPITMTHQPDRAQEFIYTRQPYYYNSANNQPSKHHIPYYWETNEIAEFGISQRGNPSNNEYSVDKVLLVQANKQAIRLIQQQQRCINLLNDNLSQTERAQNLGRMKQISQQIKLNNQRMLELKIKIDN